MILTGHNSQHMETKERVGSTYAFFHRRRRITQRSPLWSPLFVFFLLILFTLLKIYESKGSCWDPAKWCSQMTFFLCKSQWIILQKNNNELANALIISSKCKKEALIGGGPPRINVLRSFGGRITPAAAIGLRPPPLLIYASSPEMHLQKRLCSCAKFFRISHLFVSTQQITSIFSCWLQKSRPQYYASRVRTAALTWQISCSLSQIGNLRNKGKS